MSSPSGVGDSAETHPTAAVRQGRLLLAAAILLAAANLRPAVASVGPVLDDIRLDLGLSGTAASVLTSLPILCFAGGALLAPTIARRFGTEATLLGVFAITTVGLLLRLVPDTVTLFTGTFLAGAAIAVANVLIPAIVKRDFAARTGLMMGMYISLTIGGASVSAALTVPIAQALRQEWPVGLAVWALPAVLCVACWLAVMAGRRRRPPFVAPALEVSASLLRDRVAWHVTVFMSLQSLGFYALLAWLPSVHRSYGVGPEAAGQMLSLMIILGVPIALIFPSLVSRARQQGMWAVVASAFTAVGLIGLIFAPISYPYVWVTLLGVGVGASFPLALTLVVLRSSNAEDAAQLSAMSQSFGYLLAALGPFVFGLLHDLTAGWTVPKLCLLGLLIPQTIAGLGAGREVYVLGGRASSA